MNAPLLIATALSTVSVPPAAQTGIGLGSALAVVCSWTRNRSILWAIVAGFFSWFYVIYFAATRKPDERPRARQR